MLGRVRYELSSKLSHVHQATRERGEDEKEDEGGRRCSSNLVSFNTSHKLTLPHRFQHTYLWPLQLGMGLTVEEDVSPRGQTVQGQLQAHQDELVLNQPIRHGAAVFLGEAVGVCLLS